MKKVKKSYLMLIVSSVVAFSILLNVKLASASEVTQLSDGFKVQLIEKKTTQYKQRLQSSSTGIR